MLKINNVAIIIVIYKFPKNELKKLIRSIRRQGVPNKSIFVRDNTEDNIGYAPAINELLRKIMLKPEYDYIFILNPDIQLGKNCIKHLLDTMETNSQIGIIGPRMILSGKNHIDGGSIDAIRYSSILRKEKISKNDSLIKYVDYVSGSAMIIRTEVLRKVGLLLEDYFIYYEEVDFCFRAKKAGFLSAIDTLATVKHSGSATVGKKSPAMQYYMARNHLLFVERFAPFLIKLREILRIPKTVYTAIDRKYELLGIRDYFLRRFGRNKMMRNKVDL